VLALAQEAASVRERAVASALAQGEVLAQIRKAALILVRELAQVPV